MCLRFLRVKSALNIKNDALKCAEAQCRKGYFVNVHRIAYCSVEIEVPAQVLMLCMKTEDFASEMGMKNTMRKISVRGWNQQMPIPTHKFKVEFPRTTSSCSHEFCPFFFGSPKMQLSIFTIYSPSVALLSYFFFLHLLFVTPEK